MKIDLDEYTPEFERIIGVRLTKQLKDFVNNYLLCGRCKLWKKDAEFAKAANKSNRRGRFHYCRSCQKTYYKERKVEEYTRELLDKRLDT